MTLLARVMCPPTKAPNVTAGLTCPPEMFAPTETATNSAKAWASDACTRPAGVADPSLVSLSAKKPTINDWSFHVYPSKTIATEDDYVTREARHHACMCMLCCYFSQHVHMFICDGGVESVLKAIPEPSPAKTKMSMEMNSARAAFRDSA